MTKRRNRRVWCDDEKRMICGQKDKPKRLPIPDHIPRMEVELTPGADACADCGDIFGGSAKMSPKRWNTWLADSS